MFNIYLLDLANDTFEIDNKSIPIGIGYVGAYCIKSFKEDVKVRAFRRLKSFLDKLEIDPPNIVGFGSYGWNYNLSIQVANLVKKRFPKCLIVFGGANIGFETEDNKVFLKENPSIDCLIYGEGELPFSNLVKFMFQFQKESSPIAAIKSMRIDGVRSLNGDNIIMGKLVDRVNDLSDLPSPYLTGFLDNLLKEPMLMPIIQNVRGCPYQCCFCVSGTQSNKLRSFPCERVVKEIDYLRENAENRILRFSDDNFSIMEGDLLVAKYINETSEKYNYPLGLKLYTSKKMGERTRQISKILKKLTIMNISFQTMTPEVLKNSKRYSLSMDEVTKNLEFARKEGIATGTELVFGLPGETLNSMKEVINKTVEARFNSVSIGVLWLLKGSELATPKMRKQYQYKSKFMLAENAITYCNGILSIECDEIAVASSSYTIDEFKSFVQLGFIIKFIIYYGYARELLYHALSYEIKAMDLFQELIDNPDKYPIINQVSIEYCEKYMGSMHNTKEELFGFAKCNIDEWIKNKEDVTLISKSRMVYGFLVKLLFDNSNYLVIDEIANSVINLYKGKQLDLFKKLTKHIKDLIIKSIINPKVVEDNIKFVSEYDIKSWIKNGYINPLLNYHLKAPKTFLLRSCNPEVVKYIAEKDKKERKTTSFNFFRYANSSEFLRVIV